MASLLKQTLWGIRSLALQATILEQVCSGGIRSSFILSAGELQAPCPKKNDSLSRCGTCAPDVRGRKGLASVRRQIMPSALRGRGRLCRHGTRPCKALGHRFSSQQVWHMCPRCAGAKGVGFRQATNNAECLARTGAALPPRDPSLQGSRTPLFPFKRRAGRGDGRLGRVCGGRFTVPRIFAPAIAPPCPSA